jgi:hypothetical protein
MDKIEMISFDKTNSGTNSIVFCFIPNIYRNVCGRFVKRLWNVCSFTPLLFWHYYSPLHLRVAKTGKNQLNEEVTPFLPTGIDERFSQTCSALAPMWTPPYKRKCNSGGPLVNSLLWALMQILSGQTVPEKSLTGWKKDLIFEDFFRGDFQKPLSTQNIKKIEYQRSSIVMYFLRHNRVNILVQLSFCMDVPCWTEYFWCVCLTIEFYL